MSNKKGNSRTIEFQNLEELLAVPQENHKDLRFVPLSLIVPSQFQPRKYFSQESLEELANSIQKHGILEPLVTRPLQGLHEKFELIAGERRYRASLLAEIKEVPIRVIHATDLEVIEIALIENLQREDLNPVEETEAILKLLSVRLDLSFEEIPSLLYRIQKEVKGKATDNVVGQAQIEIVNKTLEGFMTFESFMSHRLRLLNLPSDILDVIREGKLAYTKATELAKVKDLNKRQALLNNVIQNHLSLSEIKKQVRLLQTNYLSSSDTKLLRNDPLLIEQVQRTTNLLKKSKVLSNSKKRQQLSRLLEKIEALLSE